MSFPDPHHPWDPPASEIDRVPWQDLDLPPGHPGSPEAITKVLADKPPHWLAYYEDRWANAEGGPVGFSPGALTDDMIREIAAKTHVMNELIDEACGRVVDYIDERGWLDDTDIFFTTDHGELQGDFGLLFKGPFHVDALDAAAIRLAAGTERRSAGRSRGVRPGAADRPHGHHL